MPTEKMPRILSVGAFTLDTIFRLDALPPGPGKYRPLEAVQVAAGMAAAAARSAARLGAHVALWASVGDDAAGNQLIAELTAEGVDCTSVRRVHAARSAFSSIFI